MHSGSLIFMCRNNDAIFCIFDDLKTQIRELRESIELPLMNPELFIRVGIKHPRVFFCMDLLVLARHY
ncbi:unnamed protein product [Lactuca virosa]|uniref:Uncharacterized protein n=1 Tax=Lactuca virosa TaxID=75947 RepID=A0AAU9MU29_9ASTR|nr:unnamed protein product [Lactuca virosa]